MLNEARKVVTGNKALMKIAVTGLANITWQNNPHIPLKVSSSPYKASHPQEVVCAWCDNPMGFTAASRPGRTLGVCSTCYDMTFGDN